MRLFFTDLDDTLFSTIAKHAQGAKLQAEAFLKDGAAISYSSHQQRSLTTLLGEHQGALIPVTARSTEALARTRLMSYESAVCSNGSVILDTNGRVDADWQSLMSKELADYQDSMMAFQAGISLWAAKHDVRQWLVSEPDLGHVYCVLKSNTQDHRLLEDKARELEIDREDWIGTIHCNGNNLAIIPGPVSKARAVRFLIERYASVHDELTTFGVGDSRSDWEFMSLCDFAIVPKSAQLAMRFLQTDAEANV